MILFCCFMVYSSQLLFFSVFTVLKHCYVYVLFSASVFTLSFREPLLQCVCSLGSEETWTRRERGRERKEDNHMKRSVLSHSNNYCDHVHHICACDYCRIFIYSFTTKGFDIYILQPSLFHYTWVFLQPVLYLKRVGQLSYLCC